MAFELAALHEGGPTDWPRGEHLKLPRHGVWCQHPPAEPHILEVQLNEIDGQTSCFLRDPAITCPLERAFIRAPGGIPILAAEIVLLYKSATSTPTTSPSSGHPARRRRWPTAWLRAALARQSPAHAWLAELDAPLA